MDNHISVATLASGCFWCIEAQLKQFNGITEVTAGYAGGNTKNPTYTQINTGNTNHAEVCKVKFNTNIILLHENKSKS